MIGVPHPVPDPSAGAALPSEADVLAALADVPDPEIPVISIVDLGLVERIHVDGTGIHVALLPTFVGCPALDAIRDAAVRRLAAFGRSVDVRFTHEVPWTSDRITDAGRQALRRAGFAPPSPPASADPPGAAPRDLVVLDAPVPCPHCGSRRTRLENLFGPTQCRSIRWCAACRQPFESFKPV